MTLYRKSERSNRHAWHIQAEALPVPNAVIRATCGTLITPSMATTTIRPHYVCWNCQVKRAYVAEQARQQIKSEETA